MASDLAPALGPLQFARWMWRQLTSMRTALMLLLLLAIVALPGSFIPQRSVDSQKVEQYYLDHTTLAPILNKLGFFAVYSSPWFSAVYLLLMISLVGCIVPRVGVYARQVRARPPKAPRNLSRLPASGEFTTAASPADVMAAGRRVLTRRRISRYRIDVADGPSDTTDGTDAWAELSAEKGYLREFGNLLFHVSILVVLVGVAVTNLWGWRGKVLVTEGDGFSNTLSDYNEFSSGALFNVDHLPGFTIKVKKVTAEFRIGGTNSGSPKLFRTQGTVRNAAGTKSGYSIEVNHPLNVDGAEVYMVGQGYAPVVKVTDAKGHVVFDDAVPFLPQDATYTSSGVIKVPDAQPTQLGFQGFFIPTAVSTGNKAASQSLLPTAANPLLGLFMWKGNLGLDSGVAQSVYALDTTKMTQVKTSAGKNYRISLSPGQYTKLPGGGRIEFVELRRWVQFEVATSPFVWVPLVGVAVGIAGLMLSLSIRPRRTWIRARSTASGTVVEVGALDRVPRDELPDDLQQFLTGLRTELGEAGPAHDGPGENEPQEKSTV